EQVFGGALNVLGNRMAVSWPGKQGAKDEEVERALQQPNAGRGITRHCVDILQFLCRVSGRKSRRAGRESWWGGGSGWLSQGVEEPTERFEDGCTDRPTERAHVACSEHARYDVGAADRISHEEPDGGDCDRGCDSRAQRHQTDAPPSKAAHAIE